MLVSFVLSLARGVATLFGRDDLVFGAFSRLLAPCFQP